MVSPPVLEESLAYRIHRSARLLRRHFLSMATSAGFELTQEQWFVLNKLSHQGGQSQRELGDSLLDDRPNVARILAGMEARGWVRRAADPQDGRRNRVWLTEEGQALHDSFAEVVQAERSRLFGGFDEEAVRAAHGVVDLIEERLIQRLEDVRGR